MIMWLNENRRLCCDRTIMSTCIYSNVILAYYYYYHSIKSIRAYTENETIRVLCFDRARARCST